MQRKWRREWERCKAGQLTARSKNSALGPLKTLARTILPPVTAAAMLWATMTMPAYANPNGGQVTSGAGSIAQNGNTMNITQTTNKMSINWQSFNIAANETVNFVQPGASSIALNRVVGNNASSIYGHLNANGQVFLVNTNGVLFAPGSSVNVGGIVASTLNISDSDFQKGNYTFSGNGGSVVNQGTITATNGGYAALLGGQVSNQGVIVANEGTVALGAGNAATLDFNGDGLYSLAVTQAALNAAADNRNLIQANGGQVYMTARAANNLTGSVLNNSGVIEAQSINSKNGTIVLDGGTTGAVTNSGTLDASGKSAGQTGGTVKVLGNSITLAAGTKIDVAGDNGGGTALIGGNSHGQGPEQNAAATTVANGATISAAAITNGNGGKVVVWSDDTTTFNGTISAKGGSASGDGGSVETSGKILKVGDNALVTTLAANGANGNWLLDPDGFTISLNGDMTGTALTTALANGNVTIASTRGSGTDGNINVSDTVTWSANTLTLNATNNIYVNNVMTASGTAGFAANYGHILDASGNPTATVTSGADTNHTPGTNADGTPMGLYTYQGTGSFTGRIDFSGTGGVILNGTPYTVINSVTTSTAYGVTTYGLDYVKAHPAGNYVMGSNFSNLAMTGLYANWSGAIGDTTAFIGNFNGFGHSIYGQYVGTGLFGTIGSGAVVSNLSLSGQVTPDANNKNKTAVGMLANVNQGSIINSYVMGSVNVRTSTVADATVQYAGHLVGDNAGLIAQCYAGGNVLGVTNIGGGLVGLNEATGRIIDSSTRGSSQMLNNLAGTTGISYVGGLVGVNDGDIERSFASDQIQLTDTTSIAGSFVGKNTGTIDQCYAYSGYSSGYSLGPHLAGFVGENTASGKITNAYTTALYSTSSSGNWVAGFAYKNAGTITNAYATSYSANTNTATRYGFVADNTGGTITNAYWYSNNKATNATVAADSTATKLDSATAATFSSYIGFDPSVWAASVSGYPILKNLLVYTNASTTYGSATSQVSSLGMVAVGLQGGGGYGTADSVANAFAVNTGYTDNGYIDAGTYSATDLLSHTNYMNVKGNVTVNRRALTISGLVQDKTYDGTTATTLNTGSASSYLLGLVGDQKLAINYTGAAFADKNAGSKSVNLTYTVADGANGGKVSNYTIATTTTANITKKSVSATLTAADKTYDGSANATVSTQLGGTIAGDAVSLSYTAAQFADQNAGQNKVVTISGITLTGADSSNYSLPTTLQTTQTTTTATINPRPVDLYGTKQADGINNFSAANIYLTNLVPGDSVTLGGSVKLAAANSGLQAMTDMSGLTISNPNYTLVGAVGTVTVNPVSLALDHVASGTATISSSGTTTTITTSDKAVIDWYRFGVGVNETVDFEQPSTTSIVLNRVTGNEKSVIDGVLASGNVSGIKGRVFIINSSGVLFTTTSTVDVGALVASTLNMSDSNFNAGNYVFTAAGGSGSVVAAGDIFIVDGGFLALTSSNGVTFSGYGKASGGDALLTSVNQLALTLNTADSGLGSYAIHGLSGATTVSGRVNVASSGGNGGLIEVAGSSVTPSPGDITSLNTGINGTLSWSLPTITIGDGGTFTGDYVNSNLSTRNLAFNALGGDLNLNAAITWSTDRTLTLDASNNININKSITVNGTNGGLVMNYGGDYNLLTKASYSGTVLDASGNPVANQAPAGTEYASINFNGTNTSLKINGNTYTLIRNMSDLDHLDGMDAITGYYYNPATHAYDIPPSITVVTVTNGSSSSATQYYDPATGIYDLTSYAPISGYYALAQNLDAAGPTYTKAPIETLSGTFAGLGHTISNLTINSSDPCVGLIGTLGSNSTYGRSVARDIGIMNAAVTSTYTGSGFIGVGALAGVSYGNIKQAYSTGAVTSTSVSAGGLIGMEIGSSSAQLTVSDCYSDATVSGGSGLLGRAQYADIYRSHATGNVTTIGGNTGGLIGYASAINVYDSYATGQVKTGVDDLATGAYVTLKNIAGGTYVGGLIGQIASGSGTIKNSFATGNVSGAADLGGLVGYLSGNWTVDKCYANGNVTSYENQDMSSMPGIGGLIGYAYSTGSSKLTITNSHATGNVSYTISVTQTIANAGGLLGYTNNTYVIDHSYATGNVMGLSSGTGGLVGGGGTSSSVISNSYATGNVTGKTGSVGGLAGNNQGEVINSWASGNVTGTGSSLTSMVNVGGLVGSNNGTGSIINSYATGSVNGLSAQAYTGGVAGSNSGSILNSYATGKITGPSAWTGGVAGTNWNTGNITNSYYNSDVNSDLGITSGNAPNGWTAGRVDGGGSVTSREVINGDINYYLDGTINQVHAARADAQQAAAQQAFSGQQAAAQEASSQNSTSSQVSRTRGDTLQNTLDLLKPASLWQSTFDDKNPAVDPGNFSARVKSIEVDGAEYQLDNNDANGKENKQ